MHSFAKPLWILGLDGLEPSLVEQWAAAGHLPTFAFFMREGTYGRLLSTPNQMTPSAWATIGTGCSPARHGIYNFQERVPGAYRLKLPTSLDRKLPTFWELASEAGFTVITARIPMNYPVRPVRGLQVADWLAPSPDAPGFAYPESLARDLKRRFGYAFWLEPIDLLESRHYGRVLQSLLDNITRNFVFFHYLLEQEKADLFFGVLRETDVGGHIFWDFHSGSAQAALGKKAQPLHSALLQIYQHVDKQLYEFIAQKPPEVNLFIISDHGMGAHIAMADYVAPLLEKAGLMRRKEPSVTPPGLRGKLREAAARAVPWHMRRRFKPLTALCRAAGFTASCLGHIDFSCTKAYSYLGGAVGEIWLNIKGRDPQGIVEPGQEQEELEQALIRMFQQAEDLATGAPVVEHVWRREELFPEACEDIFADLHVVFRPEIAVQGVRSYFAGKEIIVPPLSSPSPRMGFHRPYGFFLAWGPDIGRSLSPIQGALEDIAPTVLALLDLPIPFYMEGHILSQIFTAVPAVSYTREKAYIRQQEMNGADYSIQDLLRIEKRLEQLGYL